jgi:hypothetical protein
VQAFFYRLPENSPGVPSALADGEQDKPSYIGSYQVEWRPEIGDYFEYSDNMLLVRQVWFRFDSQGKPSVVVVGISVGFTPDAHII